MGLIAEAVGPTGAGKSTTASLLARLYDVDSGAVRLGGVDVRDATFASLKDTVGMVTQDGHLFHESIRANVALAAPEATDAEIWEALRRARLDDVVAAALIDRLVHHAEVIAIDGDSYRTKARRELVNTDQ